MPTPLDYILRGAQDLVDKGKEFFKPAPIPTPTKPAPFNPTSFYKPVPKAVVAPQKVPLKITVPNVIGELLIPSRGYTEQQIKEAKPTLKESLTATPRVASEIYTGLGRLGEMGLSKIPGYSKVFEYAQKKTGGLLPDAFGKLEEFQQPKTAGEAKAMRFVDVASFFPVGSVKNIGRVSKVISTTEDINTIQKELRSLKIPEETITQLSPILAKTTREKDVANLITNSFKTPEQLIKTPPLKYSSEGIPLALSSKERAIVSGATPNELRSGATIEKKLADIETQMKPESPSQLSANATPEAKAQRLELESSYNNSLQRKPKNAKEANQFYNEDQQIYREMTDQTNYPSQRQEINKLAKTMDLPKKVDTYKDIGNTGKSFKDVFRNFEKVFKNDFPTLKTSILDPFDASKGRFIDMQKGYLESLNKNVVKKLGITKGSKESKWLMRFGEKNATYDEVVKVLGKKKADNIVEADKWFRNTYNELIDAVNITRKQIYPNNPEKLVPKRADYYRHFKEMTGDLSGLKNIFESPAGIDPKLAGLSPFTQPKSKWASFAQKRLGTKTTEDAVGGFLDYLPSASYAVHIDPNIGRFRALADNLRMTAKKGNMNNFIDFLDKFANDLSGKTSGIDRIVTDFVPGGRKTLRALNWVNSRVKLNTILGNLSSSIAQIFNIPQGIASAKLYSVNGIVDSLADLIRPNQAMAKSTFIKERFFKDYNQFDTGILNNTKKFASWLTGVLDEVGTKFIWNSHYEQALGRKIANPIKYADDLTRKMVAGRGIGEVPLIQKSKVFQVVAPFQLEVTNLWHVMGENVSKKEFGTLAALFVVNYIMNKGAEAIRGSAVVFDPIQAVIDAYKQVNETPDKKRGAILAGGRLAGEVLSNLPLGQTLAGAYDEYGGGLLGGGIEKLTGQKMTRKQFFGREDPTRYGSGLLSSKALQDPLYKLLPGYGGSQIKKTVQGVQALREGGSFDRGGNLQFEQPKSPVDTIKTVLFGKYSTKEAQDYFSKSDIKTSQQNKVAPIYIKAQKLKEEGKMEEAKALVDALSDEDWTTYKELKAKDKRQATINTKREILPIYQKAQKLKAEGKMDEAKALVDSLTDEEWNAYKLLKNQLTK